MAEKRSWLKVTIKKGELIAYVIGAIRYRDAFMPTIPPYETRYCFSFNPAGLAFGFCNSGNSMK